MTEEEEFFAWLDGEVDAATAVRIEAEVSADPVLTAKASAHRALKHRLRNSFDSLMTAPVPGRIAAPPIDFTAARARQAARPVSRARQWAALAATLAVGIVTATFITTGLSAPGARGNGSFMVSAGLAHSLDTQLASAPVDGDIRIGLTFRERGGALCRSFERRADSGLACRADDAWIVRNVFPHRREGGGDYRMAAGSDPRLAKLIDETRVGEPLDAEEERAAQRRGWR